MNLALINELTESRMFKNSRDFSQMSNRHLANIAMISIIICVIYRKNSFISNYLDNTVGFGDFDHIRSGGTDLANVITVLKNFKDFKLLVANDGISFPVLQFKTFARGIINDDLSEADYRRYLYAFEGFLKVSDGILRNGRRLAYDWETAEPVQRDQITRYFISYLNSHAYTMDLTVWFKKEI